MRLKHKLSLISGMSSLQVNSINSWPRCGTKKKVAGGMDTANLWIQRL